MYSHHSYPLKLEDYDKFLVGIESMDIEFVFRAEISGVYPCHLNRLNPGSESVFN